MCILCKQVQVCRYKYVQCGDTVCLVGDHLSCFRGSSSYSMSNPSLIPSPRRFSLCDLSWPKTPYINQAGLKLLETHLPLPRPLPLLPGYWD